MRDLKQTEYKSEKFYMIYVNGKDNPVFKHESLESANEECSRLARMYPDNQVYILEAIHCKVATTNMFSYHIM